MAWSTLPGAESRQLPSENVSTMAVKIWYDEIMRPEARIHYSFALLVRAFVPNRRQWILSWQLEIKLIDLFARRFTFDVTRREVFRAKERKPASLSCTANSLQAKINAIVGWGDSAHFMAAEISRLLIAYLIIGSLIWICGAIIY